VRDDDSVFCSSSVVFLIFGAVLRSMVSDGTVAFGGLESMIERFGEKGDKVDGRPGKWETDVESVLWS